MRSKSYTSLESWIFPRFSSQKTRLALLGVSTLFSCQKETSSYEPLPAPVSSVQDENILPECPSMRTWYKDADGDGYGNAEQSLETCVALRGWVSNNTDCDDTSNAINPGQTEICKDVIDNDCDGTPNSCELSGDISLSLADLALWGSLGDELGYSLAGLGDIDGNGWNDFALGAPWAGDHGLVYVVYSPLDTENFSYAKLSGVSPVNSITSSRAGHAIASAGDMNDDGYADIVVGAPFVDDKYNNIGAAYLVFGPVTGDLELSDANGIWEGEYEEDRAGYSVAGLGDVNDDGFDDILVGSYESDRNGEGAGTAYLFHGPADKGGSLSSADAILIGENAYDVAGWSVAGAHDTDGDGLADLLVGAHGNDAGGSLAGAAYLFRSPVEGEISLADAVAKFIGENEVDKAGYSLASGDIDNDGYADCIIGAVSESSGGSYAGATYVVHGPIKGEFSLSEVSSAKVLGENYNDEAGLASAGDVNSDGYDDVLIGAPGVDVEEKENAGAAYLLYSPFSGTYDLAEMTRTKFLGEDLGGSAGSAVAIAPDLNNDGFDDILVGAPAAGIFEWSDRYESNFYSGAAYIFYGSGL